MQLNTSFSADALFSEGEGTTRHHRPVSVLAGQCVFRVSGSMLLPDGGFRSEEPEFPFDRP